MDNADQKSSPAVQRCPDCQGFWYDVDVYPDGRTEPAKTLALVDSALAELECPHCHKLFEKHRVRNEEGVEKIKYRLKS